MIHGPLRAGQHGVDVREDGARGSVDPAETRDQAVRRRLLDQVLFRPPASLSGYRKSAVLDERTLIEQPCYVGSGRLTVLVGAFLDSLRPRFIPGEGASFEQLREFGTYLLICHRNGTLVRGTPS